MLGVLFESKSGLLATESDGEATLVPPNTSQPLRPFHDVADA
jgi:hypothetical protein